MIKETTPENIADTLGVNIYNVVIIAYKNFLRKAKK